QGPEPARALLERDQAGQQSQGVDRHRRRTEAAGHDRRDRRRLEGNRRRGEDPGSAPDRLTLDTDAMTEPKPRPSAGLHRDGRTSRSTARRANLAERARGPWRVVVSEASMAPTIEPGDWLLVDPTIARWPRGGSIVVFREPGSDLLAIKRVAARPGDHVQLDAGHLLL